MLGPFPRRSPLACFGALLRCVRMSIGGSEPRKGRDEGGGDASQSVTDAVLVALDSGAPLDVPALKARFPGREKEVERLCRAAPSYETLRRPRTGASGRRALEAGDRIGGYVVEGPLGEGGTSTVYRAAQTSLDGRVVALKVLDAASVSAADRRRFRREARTAATLHHPHLAEVHDYGEERGFLFYAMRLVEGGDLRERLAERADGEALQAEPHDLRGLVERIREVAEALAVVHAAGLVHRDVKPGNIAIERVAGDGTRKPGERAVLVDFGLVRPLQPEEYTRTSESSLTPAYAAPEQLLRGEADARTDLFSLGATLHDLLAGRLPRERPRAAIGLEPLAKLAPWIDKGLAAIVAKAVRLDPDRRYRSAAELGADLAAWLAGEPVGAAHDPWTHRAARLVRRHTALSTLFACGLFAFCAWAVFTLVGADAPAPIDLVRAELEASDSEEASMLAAVYLDERGFAAFPELSKWLMTAVERPGDLVENPPSDLRSTALRWIALLFDSRPVLEPSDVPVTEDFRRLLMDLVREGYPNDPDVKLALTALWGCGTADCVPDLLEWTLGSDRGPEEARLGRIALESIIHRSRLNGTDSLIGDGEAQEWVASVLRQAEEARESAAAALSPWLVFFRALAFHLRDRQAKMGLLREVPPLLVGAPWTQGAQAELWTAHGSECLDLELRTGTGPFAPQARCQEVESWGRCCGARGSEAINAAARKALEQRVSTHQEYDESTLALFDAREEATRLERAGDPGMWATPPGARLSAMFHEEDPRIPDNEISVDNPRPADEEDLLARWDFSVERVAIEGWATEALDSGEGVYRGEVPEVSRGWQYSRHGRSQILLCFTVPSGEQPTEADLIIHCLANARSEFPDHGTLTLKVNVDASLMPPRSVDVYRYSWNDHRETIPLRYMATGEHKISILLKSGTTSLRLRRVDLVKFR